LREGGDETHFDVEADDGLGGGNGERGVKWNVGTGAEAATVKGGYAEYGRGKRRERYVGVGGEGEAMDGGEAEDDEETGEKGASGAIAIAGEEVEEGAAKEGAPFALVTQHSALADLGAIGKAVGILVHGLGTQSGNEEAISAEAKFASFASSDFALDQMGFNISFGKDSASGYDLITEDGNGRPIDGHEVGATPMNIKKKHIAVTKLDSLECSGHFI
jgi:hypothetical protein